MQDEMVDASKPDRGDLASTTDQHGGAKTTASGTHTPEPWHAPGLGEIHSADHGDIAQICFAVNDEGACGTEADARRIVACVNACAGIPTDDLERWGISLIDKIREDEMNAKKKVDGTAKGTPTVASNE